MTIELAGQRVLVVGASSGIGASIARMAAVADARVAITARRADRLEKLTADHPSMVALPADVTDEAAIRGAVASASSALGGLDAVIFAAAISPLLPMADATKAHWRDILDTNLIGGALLSAAAAPHLIESTGRLVLLSSKSVRQPFADLGLYATSKAALDGLARCLPVEFPGLRVTRVVIGNTHSTGFADTWDADALTSAMERWIEAGTLGSTHTMHPDEVAAAVLQVLTAEAHIAELTVLDGPSRVGGSAGDGE